MKKTLFFALLASVSLLSHAASMPPAQRVAKAVEAMGGTGLSQLKTLVVKAHTKHWDPEQSYQPGGEMRFAGDSTYTQSRDLINNAARTDWQRKHLYPRPREYTYSEVVAGGIGFVNGVDATSRTKQSLESKPPQHAMSGIRVAAAVRELQRTSPALLLEMGQYPKRLSALSDQKAGGEILPAVRYQGENAAFIVMFEPATGLPERIRTLDYDSVLGDSIYDLVFSDWRAAGAVKYPFRQVYQFNGRNVIETGVDEVGVNPALEPSLFAIPDGIRAKAPRMATSNVPYQWVLRRQFIGVFLDSDTVAYDPQASSGLRLVDVAPGVAHFVGGTHNSLFVELDKYLVVFDAPMGEFYSKQAIQAAAKRFPGKPVKYVVLTHHHMDHTSGIRTYAAAGATVVVGQGNGAHFRKGLTAPDSLGADSPKKKFTPDIVEVADRWIITDGKRDVAAYRVENLHAANMLIGYIPDAKLGFVTDIWSPGRAPLGARLDAGQTALVNVVKRWGLEPERFAGGHGSVASFPELLRIAPN